MISGGWNDKLEAALTTAMIVLMMRSTFSDGDMMAAVG
jgi:hypothetical protein